ncbi:MAG TPA: hypothetical protein PL033_16005 [Candidatus Brocadiia bacterium]|nr:hypothetical protein [Candidatus Brocadiia bacterium]
MPELTFNAYITAGAIARELSTDNGLETAFRRLRAARVGKVVIEAYRGGEITPENRLRELRDAFRSSGFETSGGIMPVEGRGFGRRSVGVETRCGFFCYTAQSTRTGVETEIRKLARVFDEVVIDDAFLTSCRCPECDAARAGRGWRKFRKDLMAEFSRILVAAVHEENPNAKLVLKLPQYYDRYQLFGYDPATQGRIFDGIWIGTETRAPDTFAYGFVEQYEPFFHVAWIRQCVGAKFQGAWFDYLDCDERVFFEQAITTALTNPRQNTYFCYGDSMFDEKNGLAGCVAKAASLIEKLASVARHPAGLPVLRPADADGNGDLFIFDSLGMVGIPVLPVLDLSDAPRNVMIPAHCACLPDLRRRIEAILENGGQVIMTLNALCEAVESDPALAPIFGYTFSGIGRVSADATAVIVGSKRIELNSPIRLPGDLQPSDAQTEAWAEVPCCEGGPILVPLISSRRHASGGAAIVWNIGTCVHNDFPINERLNVPLRADILRFPQSVLDIMQAQATLHMGCRIAVPPRVAAFPFRDCLVLVNYSDNSARVDISGLSLMSDAAFSDCAINRCDADGANLSPRSFLAIPLAAPIVMT